MAKEKETMQSKGGKATLKKHGKKHFRDLARKRWAKNKKRAQTRSKKR